MAACSWPTRHWSRAPLRPPWWRPSAVRSRTWREPQRRPAVPASSEIATAEAQVTLPADVDLHARPAAAFVKTAMGFAAKVWVGTNDRESDAKSLLSILAL